MSKVKILVVDDYPENIQALVGAIESDDIEVFTAPNADVALELAYLHDFGLALLDVEMPGMTGFELARLLRGVKKFKSLPIIFVTAHREDSTTMLQGYGTGAVDLLFKPLDLGIVRAKVRVFVELARQRALLEEHVKELDRWRLEAEAANIAKGQFLANMSHEIRTPLAAVLGFSSLLSKAGYSEAERHEFATSIERNGGLLLRLIDDILDLSKLEADRVEFEKIDLDLKEIIADTEATLSFRAKEKGVSLEFQVPQRVLPRYLSDPVRIKQVLLNIVGNAVKFTGKGRVIVSIDVASEHTGADRLNIQVRDEGVGMTPEQSADLFRPFGQADPSTRRRFGGSGLGLFISRQIARGLEGDVKLLKTELGVGSTFGISMVLPLAPKAVERAPVELAATPKPKADVRRDFKGKRILAVDDSNDNLRLIEMYLRSTGVKLTFVDDGNKAVERVRNEIFDLVLMDVQMPGKDGREATEEIRRLGYKNPIIALTAHATQAEHDKCIDVGCNEVLVKPIDRSNLLLSLSKYFN